MAALYGVMENCKSDRAFTLIECVIAMAIVSIIAMIACTRMSGIAANAKIIAAERDLEVIRDAIMNQESGYIHDLQGLQGFSVGYLKMGDLFCPTNVFGLSLDGSYVHGCDFNWNDETEKGWRGPYLHVASAEFPSAGDRRRKDDATFAERGFWPPVSGLRLQPEILERRDGCSVYGFPGERSALDPWGNPYIIQIPPPQAFPGTTTNLPETLRFEYARVVSAGPDGILSTPCFALNETNYWNTTWSPRFRRLARQAGRYEDDIAARGDDLVVFLKRADVDEGEEE